MTPTPRRTPGGRWTVEIDGERWRVDEWMELGPTLISPAPTATVRVVGELLGQLHSLGIEATSPMVPWLTRRQSDTEWKQAATLVAKRPWAEQFDAALGHIVDINRIEATGATPHILSHTNLVHSTVRRGPEDSLVVVEWDFVGPTAPDWELGGALYTWSVEEGTVDTKRAQVLIEGYRSTGAVPPTFEPSIFATAISAWLNQLSSRMTVAVWASDDPVEQERADAEVTAMLTFPMTCQLLDDLLDAMR